MEQPIQEIISSSASHRDPPEYRLKKSLETSYAKVFIFLTSIKGFLISN